MGCERPSVALPFEREAIPSISLLGSGVGECGENGGFSCVGDAFCALRGGLEGRFILRFKAARFELVLFRRIIKYPFYFCFSV